MIVGSDRTSPVNALQLSVHGIVQGVGFRPFVYRLALRYALTGHVSNNGDGVAIVVGGRPEALQAFVAALQADAPPVARISRIDARPPDENTGDAAWQPFRILPSQQGQRPSTQIAPDIALCNDCLHEILDPANRRYQYPFTNCTNCGPRFSIVERIPYDRPNTSMRRFTMCEDCRREYDDPLDRRFHAQPNACPVCGPRLSWHDHNGHPVYGDCLELAGKALATGQVVAIKGLGGFHLAVDARAEEAVVTLRHRKNRPSKPLAIMVRDLEMAARFARIDATEAALLASPEHPIVLVARREGSQLARGIAPGIGPIGLLLAYTPLHALLFAQSATPEALVMTSGNRSDEPICTGNEEALQRLHGLADWFLLHDRDIVTRVDDSVARISDGRIRLLRRARGYSPVPIPLRRPTADILACGAEMKNSFCIVRNNEAYLSQHIGELTGTENYDFFQESVDHLEAVLELSPEHIACDQHPDYLSSRYAHGRAGLCQEVQHHHAHIGAVMAEEGLDGPVLGIVLDGAGYGNDGTVFGGEIYQADRSSFTRLARLSHLLLPGGDRSAEQPWRMALSLLYQSIGTEALLEKAQPPSLLAIAPSHKQLIGQMMDKGLHCPKTSSCGRLFDAVSAMLGLCLFSDYEGQAAMLLEHQASLVEDGHGLSAYPVTLTNEDGLLVIDSTPLAKLVCADLATAVPRPVIARRFHHWLVDALRAVIDELRLRTGITEVVLSGGCMQNKLLLEILADQLRAAGLTVHAGALVPMNDGGVALGQAYIGGHICA